MARKEHKYHFIYKTTCLKNGKYYIGMHSTDNLNDGYLGSGDRIRNSIRAHGKEVHRFEILEYLQDRLSLAKREEEIVNEELLKDPLCINIKQGGEGWTNLGFHNMTNEQLKSAHKLAQDAIRKKFKDDLKFLEKMSKIGTNHLQEYFDKVRMGILKESPRFLGKRVTEEHKKRIGLGNSIKQKGERNSQFGTIWITNGKLNKKIKKEEPIPSDWKKGRI